MSEAKADICVVGGAGHVGLPLSIVFATKGRRVLIYDINPKTIAHRYPSKLSRLLLDPQLQRPERQAQFAGSGFSGPKLSVISKYSAAWDAKY